MYIVLAAGRSPDGLNGIPDLQEISSTDDGEKIYVLRKDLKKD